MRKHFWWIICAFLALSVSIISWKAEKISNTNEIAVTAPKLTAKDLFSQHISDIYDAANLQFSGLDPAVFQKAVIGFYNLKVANKTSAYNSIITIVDLAKSSCTKRMWIVDLINKQLVMNTWVAHGKGSGNDQARNFSNQNQSYESSLGFYITDDVYNGKHGRSLRLDGVDPGFNDQARARSIVVHAAPYVCQSTINAMGRLGRSEGCPAVSPEVSNQVIDAIKGKTVLFINGNDHSYTSKYLDTDVAANYVYPEVNSSINPVVNASL